MTSSGSAGGPSRSSVRSVGASARGASRSSGRLELVERPPAVAVTSSGARSIVGATLVRARRGRGGSARAGAAAAARQAKTCSRVQTTGPSSNVGRARLLDAARAGAPARRVSPGLDAAARRRPTTLAGDRRSRSARAARARRVEHERADGLRAARARATRAARGTSAAARRTGPPRSRARSTGARRAPSSPSVARAAGRARARSPNDAAVGLLADERDRARPQLARRARSSRAASKSPRRRSPEPGVVRYAAFVTP